MYLVLGLCITSYIVLTFNWGFYFQFCDVAVVAIISKVIYTKFHHMYSYGSKKKMKFKKYFRVLTRTNNKNLAIDRIVFQNLAYLGLFFSMGNPSYRLKSYFSSRDFFFILPLFPTCSFQVPMRFPMCSPKVFPIAPHLNPICFAQSAPLLTYIGGPKGGGSPSFHRILSFGESL